MTTGPAMATTPGGTAGLAAMAASTTVAPATRTPAVASAAGSLSAMAASATFSGSAAATSSATSATSTTSTPTPSTLAATVGVRGRGMQRLVIKQNQWRRGERRTSEKCNGDLTDKTNWQHVA